MERNDYTKRELDISFDMINEKLDAIHAQVIYTNSRVSNLEKWRAYLSGGLGVLSLVIVPIILYIIKKGL